MKKHNIIIFLLVLILICILWSEFVQPKKIKEGLSLDPNEIIPAPKTLLFETPLKLKRNMGITFCILLNSKNTGDWKQILGITPDRGGNDDRIFKASLCPGGNTLAFRMATTDNWDANIINCDVELPINEYVRIDILSNSIKNGDKQNIVVYKTNLSKGEKASQVANVVLSPPKHTPANGYNEGWVFTSYKNVTSVIDGKMKNIAITTGDTEIGIPNLDNAINYMKVKTK